MTSKKDVKSYLNFVTDFLYNFSWNGMVTIDIIVHQPSISRTQEILIFNIDKVDSIADHLYVGLRN